MAAELTDAEAALLNKTDEVLNDFIELPWQRDDDAIEFRHTLRALQRIILARPTIRTMQERD